MKKEEINALSTQELKEKIVAEKENLRKLKFAHAISPIENPRRITYSRKLIAQLHTVQSARELNNKPANSHAQKA